MGLPFGVVETNIPGVDPVVETTVARSDHRSGEKLAGDLWNTKFICRTFKCVLEIVDQNNIQIHNPFVIEIIRNRPDSTMQYYQ